MHEYIKYDVDTLFVIKKGEWTDPSLDLADTLAKYDYTGGPIQINAGEFVGENKVGDKALHYFLNDYIAKIHSKVEQQTQRLAQVGIPYATKSEISNLLDAYNRDLQILSKVADMSAKNAIVDIFSKNITDPKNRTDLLTPISFKRVGALKSKVYDELSKNLDQDSFIQELEQASLIELTEC